MQRVIISLVFAVLLSCITAAQQRATFSVGTAAASRGQKATGIIAVPAGVDAATTSQSEADEKRGRELRKAEEERGRQARLAEKRCRSGKPLPTDICQPDVRR